LETPERIINWGYKTFPNATIDGLIDKFEDEFHEWVADEPDDHKELPDMYIVLVQIMARAYGSWELAQVAVDEKMGTNRDRTWNINSEGIGQHIERESDEEDGSL
tara:strand:- start:842 stop:1156 length:315 start_codon:yes stop_codon:yes gene_type:complete